MSDTDDLALLRQYKKEHGETLRLRYGAHGIGIGWKRVGGKKTDRRALIFYVAKKYGATECGDEPIPPVLIYKSPIDGSPVTIITDVVESEPAELE